MKGLLIKAWRDLTRRPLRSVLTTLGVAIGVAGLVAITSTSQNLVRAQRELFASTSQAHVRLWVWDAPPGVTSFLEADPRIALAELRLTYTTRWRARGPWMDIQLIGVADFSHIKVDRFTLLDGHYPKEGEILLDLSAAQAAGIAVGDEILCRGAQGRERHLRVSGISQSPGYLSSTITKLAIGYVPAPFLRRILGIAGGNQLLIRLVDSRTAQETAKHVVRLLRRQGLTVGTPEIRLPEQFPGKRELDALITIMFLFSAMGIIVSSFLVANTLAAIIGEQISEIGTLKALGATRWQVLTLYLGEAFIYGSLGILPGLPIGALAGWGLLPWVGNLGNARVSFQLAPEGLVLGTLVGLGMPLLGSLWPSWRGASISVREALQSYGIQTDYGQSWVDRQLQRIRKLPPLFAMTIRNLARRKGRSGLTLAVIAIATAAFIGAAATRSSVGTAISGVYATYDADAWIWFPQGMSSQTEKLLLTLPGVRAAEAWAVADGFVQLAEARLWGIPAQSTLYREKLIRGRWYRPGEQEVVVLSADLAANQGIRLGDWVKVQHGGRWRNLRVVGIVVDNTIFLGSTLAGKAFLPRTTLARLLEEQNRYHLFAVGSVERAPRAVDRLISQIEHRFQRWRPSVQPAYAEVESATEAFRLLT
ncbi:MAG: ABC transporter permease, partial [Anaerolineae bacterium]|nr:ABC transporter permease [Anaerolineae bacterium]